MARKLSLKDELKLALKGKVEIKEGAFPRIYVYRNCLEVEVEGKSRFVAGFIIKSPIGFKLERVLNSEFLVRGFESLLYSLQRSNIPITYLYASLFSKKDQLESAVYLLTFSNSEDLLNKNLDIIETSFRSVFPYYELERLHGKEIFGLLRSIFTEVDRFSSGPILPLNPPAPSKSLSTDKPEYYVPSIEEASYGSILLGECISKGRYGLSFKLHKEDLTTHLVVLGVTGSGKTTTVASILNRLSKEEIKYLVLDWSNEYKFLLKHTVDVIYSPGLTDEFSINPLIPLDFKDEAEHLAVVADIFSDVYNFTHPQSFMFKEALSVALEHYKTFGDETPNLRTLISVLEKLPLRSYFDAEIKLALIRRIKPLTEGQAGRALCGKRSVKISELFDKNVVIELGHFRETRTRQIFGHLLLKQIYDYCTGNEMRELAHVTVLEEARYLVPYRRLYDPPTTAERMIAELRKYGESVFIITQFPTQISLETIKNAGCLIVHKLSGSQDLEIIGNIISLNSKQLNFLKKLDVGEAIVKVNRINEPMLVKVVPETSS